MILLILVGSSYVDSIQGVLLEQEPRMSKNDTGWHSRCCLTQLAFEMLCSTIGQVEDGRMITFPHTQEQSGAKASMRGPWIHPPCHSRLMISQSPLWPLPFVPRG